MKAPESAQKKASPYEKKAASRWSSTDLQTQGDQCCAARLPGRQTMADVESRMKLQIQALQNELREERLRNDLKVQKVRADTDKRLLEMSAAIERETRDRETAALRATIKQQALVRSHT